MEDDVQVSEEARQKVLSVRQRLGSAADGLIAAALQLPVGVVKQVRRELGIMPAARTLVRPDRDSRPVRPVRDSATPIAFEGTKPGRVSKLDEVHHLVGKMPDAVLGAEVGLATKSVANYRRRHKIPSFSAFKKAQAQAQAQGASVQGAVVVDTPKTLAAPAKAPAKTSRRKRRSPLDPIRHLLGTMPDHDVAAKVGMNPASVGNYRRRHGIAPFRRGKQSAPLADTAGRRSDSPKTTPTPPTDPGPRAGEDAVASVPVVADKAVVAPPASIVGQFAFKVVFAHTEAVVIAPDLVAAAQAASTMGYVRSLSLLGPVAG